MAERLKRYAEWLGLVSQDRYGDEYDDVDNELTEEVEVSREDSGRRGSTAHPTESEESVVTPIDSRRARAEPQAQQTTDQTPSHRTADLTRIITVHPRTYNEARTIGEHFRDGVPVIMNLSEMEDVDAKRLVDFAAGLIFGMRGTIERVTSKVFLLSPRNVNVTAEDKERIAGGFYNQS